jgi:metal-responsive CopG/Arc/MetJ family transcriptional regulator
MKMTIQTNRMHKVTISLAPDLLEFADGQAVKKNVSRSQVISQALAVVKEMEEERLAAEGYEFYAQEAIEFASATAEAVAEVILKEKKADYDS